MRAFCAASVFVLAVVAASAELKFRPTAAVVVGPNFSSASSAAQLRLQPLGEYANDAALKLMLRKLQTIGTFMQTTAHPDDEDNVLLAMLGHGAGMRTVLVSATRGEGGQNEIGPELFEALSVLRTEEIMAAHRFDGAEQLFTRAVDFGFSFSVEENLEKWGRDEIVGDYVRHIRATRPHVIAAFVCGGEGGGQAHQASTALTVQAVRDAADPAKYPDQIREGLRPWRVMRLFCTQGFGRRAAEPDLLSIDALEFDPVLGRTFAELGTEARSMHRCQGTSQLLPLPGTGEGRRYHLLEAAGDVSAPRPLKTMFDGIDTSIGSLVKAADGDTSIASALRDISSAAQSGDLLNGVRLVRALRAKLGWTRSNNAGHDEIDFRMAQKERQFEQALVLSKRMRFEAIADDGVVAAGQRVRVTLIADVQGATQKLVRASVDGFATRGGCTSGSKTPDVLTCSQDWPVPKGRFTAPYWSSKPNAGRYEFDPGVPFGLPFTPSPFRATFEVAIEGETIRVERPVEYRYSDLVAGEKRMELHVVPAFGVSLTPEVVVVPRSERAGRGSRTVRVSVVNNTKGAALGSVRLHAPAGWRVEPASADAKFAREDEAVTVQFAIEAPAGAAAGEFPLEASFTSDKGTESRDGYQVIEYPHIHRRHIVRRAAARLKIIDARITSGLRVGYVMGVGDQVPQAIEQLGATVQMIGPDELAAGDLSKYDVIVTGVRAYERRADLRANNHRLLAYAERGGTVLVQYNKFEFNEAQYGPYPAKVSANRITDEHAPVEVLVPGHPVFNQPNPIGPESWAGWVQERGLYFLGDRDPRYVDLVRLTDPFPYNPGPKTGALVEAKVGRGRWIYIGLGLWRQLPAGTDGAYRLLANLLSMR